MKATESSDSSESDDDGMSTALEDYGVSDGSKLSLVLRLMGGPKPAKDGNYYSTMLVRAEQLIDGRSRAPFMLHLSSNSVKGLRPTIKLVFKDGINGQGGIHTGEMLASTLLHGLDAETSEGSMRDAWHGETPPALVMLLKLKDGIRVQDRYLQDDGYPGLMKFGDPNSWRNYTTGRPLKIGLTSVEGEPAAILCAASQDLEPDVRYAIVLSNIGCMGVHARMCDDAMMIFTCKGKKTKTGIKAAASMSTGRLSDIDLEISAKDSWPCQICTFINAWENKVCKMCRKGSKDVVSATYYGASGTPAHGGIISTPVMVPSGWACTVCSYDNKSASTSCEMCETPKKTSTE